VDFERGNLPHRASGDSQTRSGEVNGITNEDHTRRNLRRPRTTSNIDKALPPTPGELEHQESAPSSVLEYSDHKTKLSVEGRKSSESARSSPRDLYDAYGYKHKVKYGPRPSIEFVGRPDNMDRSNDFRPVSTLPAGLRIPTRKPAPPPQTGQGPGQARPSQQTQRSLPGILTPQETLRKAPVTPRQTRNQSSSIVNNGLLTPAKTPAEPKALKSTPEKRRLMKALQLRQKQLAAQQSIGDPPAEEAHAKPQHKIPEVDESILSAILYKSNSAVDSNLVHVAVKDLSNEESHNSEASPISIPETSEGPSTQASSITDGEDIAAQKYQEENPTEPPLLPGDADVQSDGRDEDTLRQSIVPRGSAVGEEYHASASKELHDTAEIDGPAQLAVNTAHEASTRQKNAHGTGNSALIHDAEDVAAIPLFATVEEPASISSEDQGTIPRPFSEETSPATANLPSSAEEQDLSTNLKHEQRLTPETIQAMAPEITRTQHLELSAADCSHKGHETSQEVPPIESASPRGVVRLGTNAVDTHHDEEGQPRTLQEKHGSSHEAMSTPGDHVIPHEVPLPPVDEDEELSLESQRSLVPTQMIPQQHATEGQPQSTMLQTQGHEMEATRSSTFNTASGQQAHRRIRGRGILNPPERVSSPEHSDELFLSDDSFMEELKYATVQEAKPISVSRSPIKPAFSRPESEQRLVDTKRPSRSVSSPLNSPSDNEESAFSRRPPDSSSFRSISASHSQRPEDQQVPPMPKKTGVSSGISQRIKALEQLSSRPTSPQSGASSNTSQFITLRKISVRTPPKGSNPNSKLYSKSRSQPGHPSPPPSPEAVVKSNPFSSLTKAKCPQSESISVTATIVRDARAKSPNIPVNVSEPRVIELHQSPLVVEHQKSIPRPLSPLKPPRPRYAQYSSARSGSTSSTEQKLDTPQTARRGSFASMRSKSSRASEVDMPPRSLSDSSLMSGLSSVEHIKEERKDSKRSRLMKRMSSISTMSRRSIAHALSPSPKEAPIMERQESIAEAPSTAVDVGDVNIQFPDTLVL
jgi:hypothetical protein